MNYKVSDLQQIPAAEVASEDILLLIDVNPSTGVTRSRKITVADLVDFRILNGSLSNFVLLSGTYVDPAFIASLDWFKLINTPTTIAGYGITNAYTKTEVNTLTANSSIVSMNITGDVNKNINIVKGDASVVSVTFKDTYVHTQTTPASSWSVTHGMNKYPSVTIIDSAGSIVDGEVNFNSLNAVTISFCGAFSGKAYFN